MAADSVLESEGENILYDLLINTEWPPETDTQLRGNKEHSTSVLAKAVTGPFRLLLHYLWYRPSSSSLPQGLIRLVSKQINWQLVLASNGKLLAVLQDQCIEIRSARDDFGSVIGKCQVPKDPSPLWRRVAWSQDCTLLAYADSTGTVRLFDLMGSELFVIPPAASFPGDFSYAVAGLIFMEYTSSAQWSAELLVVTYRGHLKSYLVSVGTNQSFQENYSFSFATHYSHGITAVVYHPGHRLLLVGGCEGGDGDASRATRCGLTAWRALSGSPHYKQVTSSEDDVGSAQRRGLFRLPSFRLFARQANEKDGVFRMSLSPDSALLAVIHFSGLLTFWAVPSLRQLGSWMQEAQPGFDEINPEWKNSLEKRKKIKDKEQYYPLVDVNWWSENAVILARCSGSLTVSSVHSLRNLLGQSCEWFEPSPMVTAAHDGGLLSLECETKLAHKRPRPEDEGGAADDDSGSEDEGSARARYLGYVQRGLYYVTEMERFAPPRKRPRAVVKNYRLVSLRSTTPEELYQRKIDSEEYGEALSLAQAYGLDSDLVYQRQWRKSTVSIASIQDYLSKIRKRSWVLHECVERVPENVDAARELLQYGLKGTDLEALIAIGSGEDGGRFILAGDVDAEDAPYEDFLSPAEELRKRKEGEAKRRQELLKKVDFRRLTLEQKELCRNRLKLLSYLDRLATYEEILGGPHAAEQRYDAEFFRTFRNQNIVLSARMYARESNVQALDILFTYHGAELLEHRLAILYNFPETSSPHEYMVLLPEACLDEAGHLVLIPWDERRHREQDWCEQRECRMAVDPELHSGDGFLYEEQPDLLRFRTAMPSITLLTDWYLKRAEDIDDYSRQVDCALSLVRLGRERNIPGLEGLCDDLVTLETLVYEASCEPNLSLKELQQLADIDKLRLLLNGSSEERYVKNLYQWAVPFLHRCEGRAPGSADGLLREYLVSLSKEDLTLPLKIFQHSKPDCQQKIIGDHDQLMSVALECIYSCERDDQLSLCYDVLECLPQRGYGSETKVTRVLHDQVDKLEKHLSVVEVLEKHGLQKPVSFVKSSESSREEAHQLMVKLTRHVGRKSPPVSENLWKGLLQDLLDMQKSVYTCLDGDTCLQVFTESLLCSSRLEGIRLAGHLLQRSSTLPEPAACPAASKGPLNPSRVPYQKSMELVLAAAHEYFNSSTALSDSCMSLARACLQLISDCPPLIQEELDLIRALSQLEDFDVKILPLQVRLRSDRLTLIQECIAHCPTAYKQASLLLDLAGLLRVAGEDEPKRRGQVLTLLAEQALQCHDYKVAYIHCQDLMATGYAPGWHVCSQLGECEGYRDLTARRELMAFALTHCPPVEIQALLAASSFLHTQILYQAVNYQIDPHGNGPHSPGSALEPPTERQQGQGPADSALKASSAENRDLEGQGCHPFYQSLFENPYIDKSEEMYTSYDSVSTEDFAEVLLRTGKLAETKSEGENVFPATEVLLQLAGDALSKDTTLALAYLLALPQVLDANKCFEKLPPSALSLQLAAYYYALQIYSRLAPCFKDKCHALYRVDPRELIQLVTKHVIDHDTVAWPEELEKLIGQLHLYNERLTDFTQAQILQGLGRGVDVQRFSADSKYKKETILGLAETLEENVYRISLSLAQRYNIPLWEVYMTHMEFLFTDSGLSTKDIENRNKVLGLFEVLKNDPDAFHSHMTKYVYPSIKGTDLGRMLYYYSLLEACGISHTTGAAVKPADHIKLLKKLKAVAVGLDYRKMMDEDSDPLDALEPVLSSQNVLSISKLTARLPLREGVAVSPSRVHATWLRKLFWNGDPQVLRKPPQTDSDFLHAYDACAKYFERLLPVDAVAFVDGVTFSPEAVERLSIDTRSEVTKRALKAARQLSEKARRRGADEDEACGGGSFDDALIHLQRSLAHLDTLKHGFLQTLQDSGQERLQKYCYMYDLSRSEEEKIREMAVAMVTDGQPLDRMRQLLAVAVGPSDVAPGRVVQEAIERAVSVLRGDDAALIDGQDPMDVLRGIVTSVRADVQSGGGLVSSDDLLGWLRPFCADASMSVRPRIQVLQVLEREFPLSEQDAQLLLLFRSQTVLKSCWPDKQLEMDDVESEEMRRALFEELLAVSSRWEEMQHLALLLQAWPPITSDTHACSAEDPWVKLAAAMMSLGNGGTEHGLGNELLSMCRSLRGTKHQLPPECIRKISALIQDRPGCLLPALKLLTESRDVQLQKQALEQVAAMTEVNESNCDPELLSLLLDADMLTECFGSSLYPRLVDHLLMHHRENGWDVEAAARRMVAAGHVSEGGSLLLAHRGTHPGLVTFNAALAVAPRWL
ncbi:NBAS subunit of NRZ tethering complex isoform X2 [Brienomyrus brachyistius]|uniref:NBAS subunit of NRZ tethering complex isoform X2 n=1 Tax=Brienomyrus brachyistius TaxID=42636 RepID=UPI0020B3C8DC|nr:NBAS subunit of NRZ tethering complex isoform X2 [Brienomyrus brachyistius]